MKWPYDHIIGEKELSCFEEASLHGLLSLHIQLHSHIFPPLFVLLAVDKYVMHVSHHITSQATQVILPHPSLVKNLGCCKLTWSCIKLSVLKQPWCKESWVGVQDHGPMSTFTGHVQCLELLLFCKWEECWWNAWHSILSIHPSLSGLGNHSWRTKGLVHKVHQEKPHLLICRNKLRWASVSKGEADFN